MCGSLPAAGRVVDIHRVDADQFRAVVDKPAGAGLGQVWGVLGVGRRAPVAVTAGVQQHRTAGDLVGGKRTDVDRPRTAAKCANHDSRQIGE